MVLHFAAEVQFGRKPHSHIIVWMESHPLACLVGWLRLCKLQSFGRKLKQQPYCKHPAYAPS